MSKHRPSERFHVVLRTSLGFAALGFGSSIIGAGLVFLLIVLQGFPGGIDWVGAGSAAGYVLFSLIAGTVWAGVLQRRTVVWFVGGREPTPDEARRALRLPIDLALVSGALWAGGAVSLGLLMAVLRDWSAAYGVFTVILLGGLVTVGLTYLGAEWVSRPVMSLALKIAPRGHLRANVLSRLVLTWVLSSGIPLAGVLIVLLPPYVGNANPRYSLITLAVIGLVVGLLATALLARGVAAPLRDLRLALDQIAKGRTDIDVGVNDASEIGRLQASVNDLASGLRERERMRDLFGRHVGDDVARHALEYGVSLSGDVREVTALFVDVVDSTALAARIPPDELVPKLNALFTSVVDAVGAEGGLVNKFQGDASLCIFGAPARHADPESAALRAARAIRDAVASAGELDLGIGVASGPAFAGQLGTQSRFEYTVIGDAVNEAARLTEHAKQVDGRILASDATVTACSPAEREHWRPHETIHLRGRAVATDTWYAADPGGARARSWAF